MSDNRHIVFEYLRAMSLIRHYPPSNKIWTHNEWCFFTPKKRDFESELKRFIDEGYNIKTGWTGTSIKGYRDYVIFIKDPIKHNQGHHWDINKLKVKLHDWRNKYF